MILVDTSIWIDHFRRGNPALAALLRDAAVLTHPFVIGELACGRLKRRDEILTLLGSLPQVDVADHEEVLAFITSHRLMGCGIGWIDVHLLCSTALSQVDLWTLDKRLASAARSLDIPVGP